MVVLARMELQPGGADQDLTAGGRSEEEVLLIGVAAALEEVLLRVRNFTAETAGRPEEVPEGRPSSISGAIISPHPPDLATDFPDDTNALGLFDEIVAGAAVGSSPSALHTPPYPTPPGRGVAPESDSTSVGGSRSVPSVTFP